MGAGHFALVTAKKLIWNRRCNIGLHLARVGESAMFRLLGAAVRYAWPVWLLAWRAAFAVLYWTAPPWEQVAPDRELDFFPTTRPRVEGTFASLLGGSMQDLQQLGFALAAGVLVDTFVVRPILVPAFLIVLERGRIVWQKLSKLLSRENGQSESVGRA
jgi:hypothetical protein